MHEFESYVRKYDPDQPRVPAGQPTGGQWTSGSDAESDGADGLDGLLELVRAPLAPGGGGILTGLTAIFLGLSQWNSDSSTAILEFSAREFEAGSEASIDPSFVSVLSRDQVDAYCPRHGEVQERTSRIAREEKEKGYFTSPQEYGTLVHKRLADEINGPGGRNEPIDPNFRAEVSLLKSDEERYGRVGTIRVDVLERVDERTVCVYDIKTGRRGLSIARMNEIATNVNVLYPGTHRIVVIETRPR